MSERACLRCGAAYDEGATVCFTCGASIGELETPTQPVRTPKAVAAAAAATADGASETASEAVAQDVSASSLAHAQDAGGMSAYAPEAASSRLTVGSAYRPAAPSLPPARRPSGRQWALLGVVALVALAALGAGGYALRAALAGPPLPKSVVYHDPGGRFSFIEPTLWTVTAQAQGALITDSSGANSVTIQVTSAQSGETAASLADATAKQLGLQNSATTEVGGDTWQQRSGQVTGQDGATRQMVALVDVRAGEVFTIELSSPTASYTSINNLVYQPLLASFTFS